MNRYTHCFTRVQLELIIDDYLGLEPYYRLLNKRMKDYISRLESIDTKHISDKAHPIRIYTKDYMSKNLQDCEGSDLRVTHQSPKYDIRTTYSSYMSRYYYIYPLQVITNILESQEYYKELPKNIIINHMLTTQNIQIIIETLNIVSEEMSKKIKMTLSGKQVKGNQKNDGEKDEIKEEEDSAHGCLPTIHQQQHQNYAQSKIEIADDLFADFQQEQQPKKPRRNDKLKTLNLSLKTDKQKYSQIGPKYPNYQHSCNYCRNYLTYLNENFGENFTDDDLNKISRQCIKYLKIIAQTITYFTLYMMENNITEIPNNINTINRIFNTIGIVITEDIFKSQLNPKNKKTQQRIVSKSKNLIEMLIPYFNSQQERCKQQSRNIYRIDELFRMAIYCPTVEQVSQQLQNYQVEQFQKQSLVMTNFENEDKVKSLLKKQFKYIKEYQSERIQIQKNIVNNKPIYKQLQFQQDKIVPPSIQPQNYNVNTSIPSTRMKGNTSSKIPFMQKNQTIAPTVQVTPCFSNKKQNKSLLIQLTSSISRNYKTESSQDQMDFRTNKNKQNKFKKVDSDKKNNIDSVANSIKNNLLKNSSQAKSACMTQPLGFTHNKSIPFQPEPSNQLSDNQFKKILFNAFNKSQGILRHDSFENYPSGNQTAPTFNNFTSTTALKTPTKKNNGYSQSLTQFIGRKQEQQQMQCMQKLQKYIYNKKLLNGVFVRGTYSPILDEVYQQIKSGTIKIYQNYKSACCNGLKKEAHCNHISYLVAEGKGLDSVQNRKKMDRGFSKAKGMNVIFQNSTKFNQSGLVRNQKYNKSIKSQLINHRKEFLWGSDSDNFSKNHLAKTKQQKSKNAKADSQSNLKQIYNSQLNRIISTKKNLEDQKENTQNFIQI